MSDGLNDNPIWPKQRSIATAEKRIAALEAENERLLELLKYEHEERVGPHDCSDGMHARSACTFLDSLEARAAFAQEKGEE